MIQPLVSRPPYGGGNFGSPMAESKLPGEKPVQKGVSLAPELPGTQTYSKPVDDQRTHPKRDESIYRVDGPDDMQKDQTVPDAVEVEYVDSQPSFNTGVGGDTDTSKTTYPYRDGIPNAHNASASFVVALWRLQNAPVRRFGALDGVRVASTSEAILSGLDKPTQQRASKCSATLKRADIAKLRWIFSVDCGNGAKAVKIRAIRPRATTTAFGKLDLELSCSCNAWQWLGPEFHAKSEGYQLGKPRGTATAPDIKDPERVHKVCKHVAAVLLVTRGWTVPKAKGKAKKASNPVERIAAQAAEPSSWETGCEVRWDKAPPSVPAIFIRASGPRYQIRRAGDSWPESWSETESLTGLLSSLGVGRPWTSVPLVTKVWLRGSRKSLNPFM